MESLRTTKAITLTTIAPKLYNALLLNSIWSWGNSLEKSGQLLKKLIHKVTGSDNPLNRWKSMCQKSQGNINVHRFLQGIWFCTQKKDGANTTNVWSPQATVTAIMKLYKITRALVCSPNSDTDLFDIIIGVLQGDTLVPYMFIICLDYVLWMLIDLIKEKDFTLKKDKKLMISHKNNDGCILHRWSRASFKCTCPNQIPAG